MGLSSEQFWKLTPSQFNALSKRKKEKDKQNDYCFGVIASTIANIVRGDKGEPFKPEDFFSSLFVPKPAMKPEDIIAAFKFFHPGVEKKNGE